MERMMLFYKPSLERIGITVSVRIVDDAQYQNRLRSFDFDIITDVWARVAVARQRAARVLGIASRRPSRRKNTIGIKNPAVDALIDKHHLRQRSRRPGGRDQGARSGAAVEFLCRAAIYLPAFRDYARWDRFSHAEPLPKYGRSGLPSLWWFDAEKAAKIGKRS